MFDDLGEEYFVDDGSDLPFVREDCLSGEVSSGDEGGVRLVDGSSDFGSIGCLPVVLVVPGESL